MHRASAADNQAYWDKLMRLHEAFAQNADPANKSWEPELGKCGVQLERIVWDNRIMCFVVRLNGSTTVQVQNEGGSGTEELQFASTNPTAHVTVGTADQSVKPKESNDLLKRWLENGTEGTGIGELAVKGNAVLEGSVRGVLGRM
jgi:tRNA ligase